MTMSERIKVYACVFCLLVLQGCSTLIDQFVRAEEKINHDAVEASIFTLCEMASVGAIRKEFKTAERISAWQNLCSEQRTDINPAKKIE